MREMKGLFEVKKRIGRFYYKPLRVASVYVAASIVLLVLLYVISKNLLNDYSGTVVFVVHAAMVLILIPVIYLSWQMVSVSFNHSKELQKLKNEVDILFELSPSIMLVIDATYNIVDVNRLGLQFSGMTKEDIIGHRGGDVFKCVSAYDDPEGCGSGRKCDECILRRSVSNTLLSGKSYHQEMGQLATFKDGKEVIYDIKFSTEIISEYPQRRLLLSMDDVTEIVRKEEALISSEMRYKALIDHVDDGIIIYNRKLDILGANIKARQMFGYSLEAMKAMKVTMFIEDESTHEAVFNEESKCFNEVLSDSKGNSFVGDISISSFVIGKDRLAYINIKDVTKTLAMEEELLRNEVQLEAIFNNTPSLLCLMKNDGTIVRMNKQRRKDEMDSDGMTRFNHYDAVIDCLETIKDSMGGVCGIYCQHCTIKETIQSAIKTGEVVYRKEGSLLSHQGLNDRVYVVFSVIHINELQNPLTLVAVEDVTEHRLARKEIMAREIQYRALFESSRDGICLLNMDGRYLDANRSFLKIIGYELNELKMLNYRDITPSEWVDIEERYMDDELIELGYISTYEKQYIRKNGQRADVELSVFSIRDENMKRPIVCAIVRDTSEKKVLVKQIRESQKMQAIGLLAGGIAHDFNNILAGMMGYAELALTEQLYGSKTYNYLSQVLQAGDRAKNLVRQILTFSRQGGDEKKVMTLSSLIAEVVDLIRASIPPSVHISLDINTDAPVYADSTNIHEAVMNLATNAAYAVGEKGSMTVKLDRCELTTPVMGVIGMIHPNDYVTITVEDDGSGMDMSQMNAMFDPFFTTKAEGEGTGLGLSVVYGIMQGHDGDIKVQSELGVGTTIALYFPMSHEVLTLEEPTQDSGMTRPLRILYLDDEQVLVALATELFRKLGHQIVTIDTPVEAIEILKADSHRFDLLVTDYAMPHMNGLELIECLRESSIDVPAVICSGNVNVVDTAYAKSLNIIDVLAKPITMHEFQQTLAKAAVREVVAAEE